MTGINATKIIQNLEFVNSFALHHGSRARCSVLERVRERKIKERERENLSVDFYFSVSEIGSGADPLSPVIGVRRPSRSLSRPSTGIQIPALGPHGLSEFNWHGPNPEEGSQLDQFD